MPTFTLVFVGITVALIPVNFVTCRSQNLDIINLLKELQSGQSSKNELVDNEENDQKLQENIDVLKLLQKLSDDVQSEVKYEHNRYEDTENSYETNIDTSLVNVKKQPSLEDYLAELLSEKRQKRKKKNQNLVSLDDPENDYKLDLNNYSKIYLVLDPKANLDKKDISQISRLVSKLLTKQDKIGRYYKGFRLADNFQSRRIRDSRERFEKRESREYDYKQKRARNDFGGSGGRTAIPYIRHQGGIFEKRE